MCSAFVRTLSERNQYTLICSIEERREWRTGCHKKHFQMQTNSPRQLPATQGQSLPEGKETVCVRGRDAYTGADLERAWPIDCIKLPVKDRNQYVFKDEAGCMWRMRVGFIDTTRCV